MLPPLQIVLKAQGQEQLQLALEFMQRWNVLIMRRAAAAGKPYPRLTRDLVRYKPDPLFVEVWQPCDVLLESKIGNCDSFAAYEAAWLQLNGFPEACVEVEASPAGWHCIARTKRRGGLRVDPSKRLGMPL